jgi:UDP-glucose 4-epimerase
MRVLVTGGAGFIGSHVVDGLLAAGHSVAVVDDLSTGCRAHVHPSVRVCPLDIRNPDVADVFQSFRPDVLCHHAAQIDVRRSVADPVADADVNILGSLRLLELCRLPKPRPSGRCPRMASRSSRSSTTCARIR